MLHSHLFLMNGLTQTESAVFLLCRFILFLMDPLFRLFILTNVKQRFTNNSNALANIMRRLIG